MQPQIITKPAFTVVGVRIRTNPKSNEIPQLWQQHGKRLSGVQHVAEHNATYGVMEVNDMEAGVMDYMAGVAVTKAADLPDGMSSWEVPAATYAVLEATLPTISETFDYIFSTWLPGSDYQPATGPEFEYYGPEFSPHDQTSKLSVYIPVKKFYKPTNYSTVSPYLVVDGASDTIDFLVQVFGAVELRRFPNDDDKIMHAEVRIDDTVIMLADGAEGWSPSPSYIHIYVPDVGATYERAIAAGAEAVQEPVKKDDEDKRGGVKDTGGTTWWIATKVE